VCTLPFHSRLSWPRCPPVLSQGSDDFPSFGVPAPRFSWDLNWSLAGSDAAFSLAVPGGQNFGVPLFFGTPRLFLIFFFFHPGRFRFSLFFFRFLAMKLAIPFCRRRPSNDPRASASLHLDGRLSRTISRNHADLEVTPFFRRTLLNRQRPPPGGWSGFHGVFL